MDSNLVHVEFQAGGVVRITPKGSLEDISLLPAVLAAFEREFRKKCLHFILDLGALHALPAGWIVLIFELTARSRRRGGDLCVVNLPRKAQGDLLNFQPENYLCLEEMDFVAPLALSELESAQPAPKETESQVEGAAPADSMANPAGTSAELSGAASAIEIPSRVDALYRACDFVLGIAEKMGFGESDLSKIKISVYEASLNAIEHAYHSDGSKQVRVQVSATREKMVIQIIDRGDGFDVIPEETFDVTAAAAARRTGGMGLHIIRRSMDKVTYLRDPRLGNRLIMEKLLPAVRNDGEPAAGGTSSAPDQTSSGRGGMAEDLWLE